MAFEAGKLNVKVTILRRTTAHDGLQLVETWQAIGQRWCSRRAQPGGERGEAEGRRSFTRLSLWLRLDSLTSGLLATDAVAIDGQRYELVEPPREIDVPARRGIELLVEGTGEVVL